MLAGSATEIQEAVLDKGYHDNELLAGLAARGVRTYIPERRQKSRRWTDKPADYEAAILGQPSAGVQPQRPAVEPVAERTL